MLSIRVTGFQTTIRDLENLIKTLDDKVKELVERLMREGYDIASVKFADAKYAGRNDVIVSPPIWEGNTMVLRANGDNVAFIEFGTGSVFEDYPEPAMRNKVGAVGRGQYGKKQGKGTWVYVGDAGNLGYVRAIKKRGKDKGQSVVETVGNPPARAMYEASLVLDREHIEAVAREVFK